MQNMAYPFQINYSLNSFIQPNYFQNPLNLPFYPVQYLFATNLYRGLSMNTQINRVQTEIMHQLKNNDKRDTAVDEQASNQSDRITNLREIKTKKKSRNVQKELESAKKNCQSNLVNQFLSYFSSYNNSYHLIIKALKKMKLQSELIEKQSLEKTVMFFCKQVAIVNSRKERKYVNKAFLQNFFFENKLQKYMGDILENVDKMGSIKKNQFCELFRRCCFHFFRTISVSSVTSSAKLNPISRPQHIKRRRLIVQNLCKK